MTVEAYLERRKNIFKILGKNEDDKQLVQDFNDGYFDQNISEEPNSPLLNSDVYPYGLNGALRVIACEQEDENEQQPRSKELKFQIKPELEVRPLIFRKMTTVEVEQVDKTSCNTFSREDSYISKFAKIRRAS